MEFTRASMDRNVDPKFAALACVGCGAKTGEDGGELKRCTGCKKTMYCGKKCQKKDWKEHKLICKSD